MSTTPRPSDRHVIVLGAGYAGMIATNRLLGSLLPDERPGVRVTVVNPRPDLVERIRLHELAAGTRSAITRPLGEVLHPAAELVVGRADSIDHDARTVRVTTPTGELVLAYDQLVYAVGSSAAGAVPGAREHGFLLGDLDGAQRAADVLRAAAPGVRVAVVGGGLTGVEAAAEIAERRPDADVVLLTAGPLVPLMRPAARRSLLRTLRRLGVTVTEGARVAAVEQGAVVMADGGVEAADLCILATSFVVPELARASGLSVDSIGRLRVDATLRSVDSPAVVGAGDAVTVAGSPHLRMSCAAALPLGAGAAETVLADLRGSEPTPVSIGFAAQCLSLGRRRGYVQLVRADDSPRRLSLTGRAGSVVKEQICRMVVDRPVREGSRPGAYRWPRGPRRRASA